MLAPRRPDWVKKQDLNDHRESIALKAMVAILGNPSIQLEIVSPVLAAQCYWIADAMIEQKNKLVTPE